MAYWKLAIREGEPINGLALVTLFLQIFANNRANGWRRFKGESSGSR